MITTEQKKAFVGLACRLSPENLMCDGEISRAEGNRRYAQIKREWRQLEKEAGHRVSEEQADQWMVEGTR